TTSPSRLRAGCWMRRPLSATTNWPSITTWPTAPAASRSMSQVRLTGGPALVMQAPETNLAPAILSLSIVSVHADPSVVGVPKQSPDQQTSTPQPVDEVIGTIVP